jgi:hypothetical protein
MTPLPGREIEEDFVMIRVEVFDHTGDGFKGRPKGPSVGFLVADGDRVWAEPAEDRHLRKVLRHGMPRGMGR